MSTLLRLSLVFSIVLASSCESFARYAAREDSAVEYEFYNRNIYVRANGTSEEVVEQQVAILSEYGRKWFGTHAEYYNADSEKLQILSAETEIGGVRHKVHMKMIEDKPVASQIKGFDSIHQVTIAYPKAEIGAKLYLKYKRQALKPRLKNFYDTNGYWGSGGYWKKSILTVKSEIPFHLIANDPHKKLEIKHFQEKGLDILKAELKEPLCTDLVNETATVLGDEKHTWVKLSTLSEHADFIKRIAPKYEEVIASKLPKLYAEIAEGAKNFTSEIDQINHVTSKLSEVVRYMGDWRSIKGGYFPRELEEIVKAGFGDCKDFSVSAAAILRSIGYKTNALTVWRGEGAISNKKFLPGFMHNHAMIKAISPSGKEYFIDPTNFISMADGTFPDIAGKMVYVLDSSNPIISKVPDIDYKHSKTSRESTFLVQDGVVKVTATGTLFGEEAAYWTGAELQISRKEIEEILINQVSGDVACLEKKVHFPDLTSRIVKNLEAKYEYKKLDDSIKTNLGNVISFPIPAAFASLASITDDREGDFYIRSPHSYYAKSTLKNANTENLSKLNFKITSPWVNFERKVTKQGSDVAIEYKAEIVKGYIENSELQSAKFKKIRDEIKKNLSIGVIVKS